jgi:ribosomal protein S18 acetylase RimI-like enzyme
LRGVDLPTEYEIVRADQIAEDRLRRLDDALRQDVPGTDGWRWDPASFHEETFASPFFDASTYLIAFERESGDDAGLVRVWNNPSGPRLGLIAVLPQHRRCGLARGLLARVLGVLAKRGKSDVWTEVDDRNIASISLLEALGARRVGGSIELVRIRN